MTKQLDIAKFSTRTSMGEISSKLDEHGLVIFGGIGSELEAAQVASSIGIVVPHRDSEPSGMTRIRVDATRGESVGQQGFGGGALFPHTDRSCLQDPPHLIMLVCAEQSADGGVSTMVDGQALTSALHGDFPDLLREMRSPAAACFDDGEHRYKGPLFESMSDGSTGIRLRNDRMAFFSAPLADRLTQLYSVILALTQRFELGVGQAYLVNNRRWLHGRDAFRGNREMWRYLMNWSSPSGRIGFTDTLL